MPAADVEAFERAVDAFERRDMEAVLAYYDPEVEWHPGLAALLGGDNAVYRGHDGVRELVRDIDEAFDEARFEFSEVRDLGGTILAIGRFRTRGRASGIETETPVAYVVEGADGRATRVRAFLDIDEAVEAAGLDA